MFHDSNRIVKNTLIFIADLFVYKLFILFILIIYLTKTVNGPNQEYIIAVENEKYLS